jgi:hypothetical protein
LRSRYLGRIERGNHNIGLANLVKVARGLGMSVTKLVEGVFWVSRTPAPDRGPQTGVEACAAFVHFGVEEERHTSLDLGSATSKLWQREMGAVTDGIEEPILGFVIF